MLFAALCATKQFARVCEMLESCNSPEEMKLLLGSVRREASVLNFLARHDAAKVIGLIIDQGLLGDIDARDATGRSCLHTAIESRSIEAIKVLLSSPDVDVNLDTTGRYEPWTPLRIATAYGVTPVIKMLLDFKDIRFISHLS